MLTMMKPSTMNPKHHPLAGFRGVRSSTQPAPASWQSRSRYPRSQRPAVRGFRGPFDWSSPGLF
jgi:hypothetical protein